MKSDTLNSLQRQADLCVKCGLCLPTCPTYQLEKSEAQSPRGRIAIIQGLAAGQLAADAETTGPLQDCLSCGECVRVCPAKVPYLNLKTTALQEWLPPRPIAGQFWLRRRPRWPMLLVLRLRRLLSGVLRLLHRSSWRRLQALPRRLPALQLGSTDDSADVALHLGCIAQNVDTETLNATAQVLTALGIRYSIPADQTCCGAVYAHHQQAIGHEKAVATNAAAFQGKTTISCATGCAAHLQTTQTGAHATDIVSLLLERWPTEAAIEIKALPQTIFVQESCTLRNELGQGGAITKLLSRIPQVKLIQPEQRCCGAAGTNFLDKPETAAQLAAPLLEQIKATKPDVVVSANVGCAMHLRSQLAEAQIQVDVVHPVVLLAACVKSI